MVRVCSIKTCKKSKEKHGVSLHKLKQSWIPNLAILNKNVNAWKPSKHTVICSEHFIENDFDESYLSKKKLGINTAPVLKSEAVPRLDESESRIPDVDIDNDGSVDFVSIHFKLPWH